jgi:hypothetical protein
MPLPDQLDSDAANAANGSNSSSSSSSSESLAHYAAAQLSYAEVASSIYRMSQALGPFSLGDLVFGVQSLAKRHQQQKLTYNIQVCKETCFRTPGRQKHQQGLVIVGALAVSCAAFCQALRLHLRPAQPMYQGDFRSYLVEKWCNNGL